MKLNEGKTYKASNGQRAFVMTSHAHNDFRYVGVLLDKLNRTLAMSWKDNGEAPCGHHQYDLIEEWKEPQCGECWVIILEDGSSYTSDKPRPYDLGRLACVKVDWKEGQFDGEAK